MPTLGCTHGRERYRHPAGVKHGVTHATVGMAVELVGGVYGGKHRGEVSPDDVLVVVPRGKATATPCAFSIKECPIECESAATQSFPHTSPAHLDARPRPPRVSGSTCPVSRVATVVVIRQRHRSCARGRPQSAEGDSRSKWRAPSGPRSNLSKYLSNTCQIHVKTVKYMSKFT